jgi:Na+-transporting NADH:ubiquinone oxidoreductase subunit C
MKNKIIPMLVFILLLGGVLTTLLVAVDTYTAPIIQRNQELKQKTTILKVLKIDFDPKNSENIEQLFQDNVTLENTQPKAHYLTKDGRKAFIFSGNGFMGPIIGVLSMETDDQTINNIEIIQQEETPGLGSRITERPFLDRFAGKTFSPELTLVPEGQSDSQTEIDGITGATMSSKALASILNQQYGEFSASIAGK